MLVVTEKGNLENRCKTLGARTRAPLPPPPSPPNKEKKIGPHRTPSLGIEPGPHWFEASALTTAPSLRPKYFDQNKVLADVILSNSLIDI